MQKLMFAIALFSVMLTGGYVAAQDTQSDSHPRAKHLALGFELKDTNGDYGLGLDVNTPYFANGLMALRVRGALSWLEGVPAGETEFEWMPYGSVQLGFVLSVGEVGGFGRFYSEAGGILVLPNSDFSDDVAFGGFGLFGFEFFTNVASPVSYFIEAGGMGTNGQSEKLGGKPSHSNGFFVNVGIRWYPY
ncbi:MAG: hypothetical protein JXX29_20650 [Deltaproteobacteria bacterium]|nr:hypothetical protein [Deltaproteobacteria bacterium]MBN2674103.1 hypothetical protein [Deltaproteobacteria bacterium]